MQSTQLRPLVVPCTTRRPGGTAVLSAQLEAFVFMTRFYLWFNKIVPQQNTPHTHLLND